MQLPPTASFSVDDLLDRMAPEIVTTFKPDQLYALQQALTQRRHAVDIRLSVPLMGPRFYLVMLAGMETRSRQRLQVERAVHPLWTPLNLVVVVGGMVTGLLALITLLQFSRLEFPSLLNQTSAPTGIPFKADQTSCEESGRTWLENGCLDYDHDPMF